MVQKFKAGDIVRVKPACYTYMRRFEYFKQLGIDITKANLTINDTNDEYIYFFKDDSESHMGFFPEAFEMVDEEPDLYVYPDTPLGTELIVTQDTVSLYGQLVEKGLVVTLYQSHYSRCGGYRSTMDSTGRAYWIDCDHLMIKG